MEKIFKLNSEDCQKLTEWQEAIKKIFGEYGCYTYKFTPTSIGVCVEVYSDLSKTTLDLTDESKW